jgi:hypothetical protein
MPGSTVGSTGACLESQMCVAGTEKGQFICLDRKGGGTGSGDGGDGGGGTSDATTSDGEGGGSKGDGSSGTDGNLCPSPQTTFGLIGQGDSNPNFLSGVGALGTNVMYILSGFSIPVGDSGTGPAVYVQAFDPKTGAKKGLSKSLFAPPQLVSTSTEQGITLYSSAVSPTGEIALSYVLHNSPGTDDIYVAFLSPSTGDGGTDGLSFQEAILLTVGTDFAAPWEGPKVIWSNSSQTFVVSHVGPPGGSGVSINKFFVSGQMASGGVSPAPSPDGGGISSGSFEGNVGESGNLIGVAYFSNSGVAPSGPWITMLDENGNLVGNSTNVFDEESGGDDPSWASVAGTAKGFVYFYGIIPGGRVGEVFISTSPDAGIVGGDISGEGGLGKFPGFSFNTPAVFGLAIADDVGTGGSGGVGVALDDGSGVSFAYVNADGIGHQGPISVFPSADVMTMTNLNGSFAISAYRQAATSTQVVASGICP